MSRRVLDSSFATALVSVILLAILLTNPGCGSSTGAQSGGTAGAAPGAAPKPGEDKAFADVIKDMQTIKGLFTFYRNADENKLLMEILPSQLDTMFLVALTIDRSIGERGFYASQMGGDGIVAFRRVGKTIQMVGLNTVFTADSGTPQARSTKRSFADAILATAKIQSVPQPERKSILVDVADFLVSDFPGFGPALSQVYQPTSYRFDKNTSALGVPRAFPENVLIPVTLHYVTENPRSFSLTLADARSVPIGIQIEISALKQTSYKPRAADDRVGHFPTIRMDYSTDRTFIPDVRYINRWHLEKADPSAALSPPKEPIVFWLENTVPLEYRPYVKEGIELWNKAFEKIGFKDAVVVKQQPDTADWDPADTRYNTIRWFAGVDASFAIGPSRANPFTGQIYDADIGFSEWMTRSIRGFASEFVEPISFGQQEQILPLPMNGLRVRAPGTTCTYANELAHQASLAVGVLEARGMMTPQMEEKLLRQFIVEISAHEVGHTLGLRHNFRGSTLLDADQLMDVSVTRSKGQSGSIMDYNPYVIAAKGEEQGDFVPTTLGPYDYWVIEYAYKPIAGDEKVELARVASRAAEKDLTYGTDEDAMGTYSPIGIDPLVNQFDQGSDPLKYFQKRLGIVEELWGTAEEKLTKPGEGYQVLRRTVGRGLNEYFRALVTSSKFVGGVYHYRDHVGDPGGRAPYEPVPAAKQQEALEFLKKYAFSETSFKLPANLHNKLAIERLIGISTYSAFMTDRLDYPWHDQVLAVQRAVLDRLMNPITLGRMLDNELRFPPKEKPFTMYDMFRELNGSLWTELEKGSVTITSMRRNLQREYTKHLIRLTLRPAPMGAPAMTGMPTPPPPRVPEDATTFARAMLNQTLSKITAALGKTRDGATRAHLEETKARIQAALDPQMVKQVE